MCDKATQKHRAAGEPQKVATDAQIVQGRHGARARVCACVVCSRCATRGVTVAKAWRTS